MAESRDVFLGNPDLLEDALRCLKETKERIKVIKAEKDIAQGVLTDIQARLDHEQRIRDGYEQLIPVELR
jgi:hypothetical protein